MNLIRSGRAAGWLLLAILFSISLCGGWFSKPVSAADTPVVTLVERVEQALPPLMLSDIIAEEVPDEFSDIYLGDLPQPGRGKFINRADIILQARNQDKIVPEFQGPNVRTHILRPKQTVTDDELLPEVETVIHDYLLRFQDEVNLTLRDIPREILILPGEYELQLGDRNPYHHLHGSDWYEIIVKQEEAITNRFRARVDVERIARVPVARGAMRRGEIIEPQDIIWEKRDVGNINGGLINDTSAIVGFETTRSFRAGQVITLRYLDRPLMVERNEPVTIQYRMNGVRVNARGVAQAAGAHGEKIIVENSSSKERLYAEIIDKRTVLVSDEIN